MLKCALYYVFMDNSILENVVSDENIRRTKKTPVWIKIVWPISIIFAVVLAYLIIIFTGTEETKILQDAMRIIRSNSFFYSKETDTLVESAVSGMTASLNDNYAAYYTEEEYAEMNKSNSGYYSGIGIVLQQQDIGRFEIIQIFEDSPAAESDLMIGDLIVELNGVSSEGLDISTFLENMNAEDGEENILIVSRNENILEYRITSRQIYAPKISFKMQTDSIGYIYLSQFRGECVSEFKDAVEELLDKGMQSLILDLRDNPGGSLYDVLDIADFLLDEGLVITTLRSNDDTITQSYQTTDDGYDFPVVVLVNKNSASASELLSGALKDHKRAFLIGTTTFGKGIVQTFYYLAGTGGYIKITSEAYYTPNNICIQGIGIVPDLIVENPEEANKYAISAIPYDLDLQLQAAIDYLNSEVMDNS